MSKKIRLDIFLFTKGFVDSRQKAQRLILAGKVKDNNGKVLDKPGQEISSDLRNLILVLSKSLTFGFSLIFQEV